MNLIELVSILISVLYVVLGIIFIFIDRPKYWNDALHRSYWITIGIWWIISGGVIHPDSLMVIGGSILTLISVIWLLTDFIQFSKDMEKIRKSYSRIYYSDKGKEEDL